MTMRRSSSHVAILTLLALLLAVPALARDAVITNGIDLWRTPAAGGTYADFARDPLPAGFLCTGSAPFTGKIVFRGVPIKTKPANALRDADTIIQRLDDAIFTKSLVAINPFPMRGNDGNVRQVGASFFQGQEVATTRVQAKAISFVGVQPVKTSCGSFQVKASLAGEQPVTEMVIVRDRESGGSFYAPLSLNIKLTFIPMAGGSPVEVMKSIQFPAKPLSVWTENTRKRAALGGFVNVDSDGDGVADLMLPGTSNFAAGFKDLPSGGRGAKAYAGVPYCDGTGDYYAPDCHQTGPILDPTIDQ
ncbi:MAG: hypothetical protein WAM82_28985 [Thermoanaerobaculia bacterium]